MVDQRRLYVFCDLQTSLIKAGEIFVDAVFGVSGGLANVQVSFFCSEADLYQISTHQMLQCVYIFFKVSYTR